jgi:hypothetical protein
MDNRAFEEIQLSYFNEVTNTADDIEEALSTGNLSILHGRLAELRQVAFELQKDLEISIKNEPTSTAESNS